MSEMIFVTVNGRAIRVESGTTVAVAILQAGENSRSSVRGQARQPMCGMGICYECRAEVNGRLHQRTCQILCEPGMSVRTQ